MFEKRIIFFVNDPYESFKVLPLDITNRKQDDIKTRQALQNLKQELEKGYKSLEDFDRDIDKVKDLDLEIQKAENEEKNLLNIVDKRFKEYKQQLRILQSDLSLNDEQKDLVREIKKLLLEISRLVEDFNQDLIGYEFNKDILFEDNKITSYRNLSKILADEKTNKFGNFDQTDPQHKALLAKYLNYFDYPKQDHLDWLCKFDPSKDFLYRINYLINILDIFAPYVANTHYDWFILKFKLFDIDIFDPSILEAFKNGLMKFPENIRSEIDNKLDQIATFYDLRTVEGINSFFYILNQIPEDLIIDVLKGTIYFTENLIKERFTINDNNYVIKYWC
jgi:hypothetical protein